VTVNGITALQYTGLAQGHMSQSLTPVHFGTGSASRVDLVRVTWPDGATETLEDVPANQVLTLERPS
jgi:hypothetical protein